MIGTDSLFKKVIILLLFFVINYKPALSLVTNNGLSLTIKTGLTITIKGDFTNQTKSSFLGTIDNSGTINISGNWLNNSNNGVFSTSNGTVVLNGTMSCQNISGACSTGFYNLTLNNVCPDGTYKYISNVNFTVNNTLNLVSGIMELNGYTITNGISTLSTGSLIRTAGWFKGGKLKRWVGAELIPEGDSKGYFPLGDSAYYRPAWISAPSSSIAGGGTISVSHSAYNEIIPAAILDDKLIIKKYKSYWNILTENITAGNFNINLLATGYTGVENINELRICKDSSVCGTPGNNAGTVTQPEAKRTSINLPQLSGAFFIGSTNGGPLPVKWIDFKALNSNKCIQLYWSTASETNNDYFTIERSLDGKIIEPIASLPGSGNSNNILNYTYYDYFPKKGICYYRIKQTDYDGKADTTEWISVNYDKKANGEFNLFPNPLLDGNNIKIEFDGETNQEALILINDLLGNTYFSKNYQFKQGENNIALDTDKKLQAGIYNLTISGNNLYYRKKLIIK